MNAQRFLLIFLSGTFFSVACQTGPEPRFRVRAPEGGGLHQDSSIRIAVQAAPATAVQLSMEPADCGVLGADSVTTDERGESRVQFTAGAVIQDCEVTITGRAGEKTSQTRVVVHPPASRAEVTRWEGAGAPPAVEVGPKVSVDSPSPGTNRFTYFVAPSLQSSLESVSLAFEAETRVEVLSILGSDSTFVEPPPQASSADGKTWVIQLDAPMRSLTLQADSAGGPGGTATLEAVLVHSQGTEPVTLAVTGPRP